MSMVVKELKELMTQQEWLDTLAKPLQNAVRGFFKSLGKAGTALADFLHGTWLGHPLHPVLTDIPIGAWIAAVVLDWMEANTGKRGFGRSADTAVTLGVAGAVSAAAAGLTDWQHLTGESRRTGLSHALFNTLALAFFVGSMVSRKGKNRGMGRVLALAGLSAATAGAYLGGDLVFRQKIGVNHAPEGVDTPNFEPVMAETDLPENTLKRAWLNDVPIVLLRRGEQIFALAETCAHLGGPLADGEIGEDDEGNPTVICPWHGSTYAMNDGRIVTGPTAYPQPCFETRVRNYQIEVRARA